VATFAAVADVSTTLVDLLTQGLSGLGTTVRLDDLQTAPAAANLMTVFLYLIREDGHTRNRPPTVRITGAPPTATVTRPPLSVSVQYLLTPWAAQHDDNQRILGQAMQTLHDNAIVAGSLLRGSLAAANEQLQLSVVTMTLEDHLRVWHGLNLRYHLSLCYEARAVRIDSLAAVPRAVVRERGIVPAEPITETA
jgi:hypothetical protein